PILPFLYDCTPLFNWSRALSLLHPVAENKASTAAISAAIRKPFFIVVKSPSPQNAAIIENRREAQEQRSVLIPALVRFLPNRCLATRFDLGGDQTDLIYAGSMRYINYVRNRSEEHTSELQSLAYLVCRLLLEK